MTWIVLIAHGARKNLKKFPPKVRANINAALAEMEHDPFSGDLVYLRNIVPAYRRRVGSHRILFDVFPDSHVVKVVKIRHRDDNTYK